MELATVNAVVLKSLAAVSPSALASASLPSLALRLTDSMCIRSLMLAPVLAARPGNSNSRERNYAKQACHIRRVNAGKPNMPLPCL